MTKFATLASASILALAGASAFAQTAAPPTAAPPAQTTAPAAPAQAPAVAEQDRRGPSRAELDALTDARIAAIQAGLKLTAEQQALWPPVEQAIRAIAAERTARFENRGDRRDDRDRRDDDFMARIERQSESARRYAEPLVAFTNALRPFWASLDEGQKRLLPILIRPTHEFAARAGMRDGGRDRDGMDGRRGRDRMDRHGMMGHEGMMGHHGMDRHHR